MRFIGILLLLLIIGGFVWKRFFYRRHKISLVKARRKMYKQLNAQAASGDQEAMYRLAKNFYREKDTSYYPLIFKWAYVLAMQSNDPSVWLMMGDLFLCGCGTDKNPEMALRCYEKAVSEAIALGANTPLSPEAHNYLEGRIMQLREELSQNN